LQKDIENYGLLKLTPKGHEFLEKPYSILLCEDHQYSDEEEEEFGMNGGKTSTVDTELFNILRDLRKKISKQKNLPHL